MIFLDFSEDCTHMKNPLLYAILQNRKCCFGVWTVVLAVDLAVVLVEQRLVPPSTEDAVSTDFDSE